jgi:hypothetical protein
MPVAEVAINVETDDVDVGHRCDVLRLDADRPSPGPIAIAAARQVEPPATS